MKIYTDFNIASRVSFNTAAKVAYWVELESEEDIQQLMRDEFFQQSPYVILGGGTNTVFTQDYKGIVLHYSARGIRVLKDDGEEVLIEAQAGEEWDSLVAYATDHGFRGIENLSLIPGHCGAACVQNIGAYGMEISKVMHSLDAYELGTGKEYCFQKQDCKYAYRYSFFKSIPEKYLITRIRLKLSRTAPFMLDYQGLEQLKTRETLSAQEVRDEVIKIRRAKLPDPKEYANAGSFFMNPTVSREQCMALLEDYPEMVHYGLASGDEKLSAAWLIEHCGFKGYKQGNVACSPKHALILINLGGAKPQELLQLAETITAEVKQRFGVELKPEVRYIS